MWRKSRRKSVYKTIFSVINLVFFCSKMPWNLPSWGQVSSTVDAVLAATGTESSKWRSLQGHVTNVSNKYDTTRNAFNQFSTLWKGNSSDSVILSDCYSLCNGIRNHEPKPQLLEKVETIKQKIENA